MVPNNEISLALLRQNGSVIIDSELKNVNEWEMLMSMSGVPENLTHPTQELYDLGIRVYQGSGTRSIRYIK